VAVLDRAGDDPIDITDVDAIADRIARVRSELGPVDILVNAAGISAGGRMEDDGFLDAWERTMAVNLTGMMHVIRACIGDLLASGHGRIVNVASTEGLGASRAGSPYTTSKHGVVGLTRSLAVEYGRRGLTTNCVCPGATLTGMTEVIPEDMRDTFARRNVPIGRYAQPEEIAYMIVALTALEATYVNGAVIPVDGGLTISLG
jgi:3-oxoacyl-[acyl-carrier protein] reductase